MNQVIAMDPGVFTGIALYPGDGEGTITQLEIPDDPQQVRTCVDFWARDAGYATVTERFLISQRTIKGKVYYQSLMLEGWMKVEYPDTVAYTPAQAKGFATDDMLKSFGWWNPSKDGHANDATRHLILHLSKIRDPWVLDALERFADED